MEIRIQRTKSSMMYSSSLTRRSGMRTQPQVNSTPYKLKGDSCSRDRVRLPFILSNLKLIMVELIKAQTRTSNLILTVAFSHPLTRIKVPPFIQKKGLLIRLNVLG